MSGYNKTVLPNGVRVISDSIPSFLSATLGLWVDVGSRDESPTENGVCHFIEHMVFKGTKSRSSFELASALESLGGNLNAFTSREQTCFYARVMGEHVPIAVDVLCDMLINPTFAEDHIGKEKGVIIEEIKDVIDTPSDHVHDLFAKAMWDKHSLGNPIMGTSELISEMTRDRLLDFKRRSYTAGRVVVAAAGNVDHDELVKLVADRLPLTQEQPRAAAHSNGNHALPTRSTSKRDSSQTNICIGFPAYRYTHPSKYALLLLHNILGSGMSSRLFQAVREELGFAYSVYSFQDFFRDDGTFCVFLGTDDKNAARSANVILSEIDKVRNDSVTTEEFESARRQLKGNLVLGLEGTSARMNRLARHELGYNRFIPVEESLAEIDRVTLDELRSTAREVFREDRCAAVFLGPIDESLLAQVEWEALS
jgi:predicted Zn-dependent peptidase